MTELLAALSISRLVRFGYPGFLGLLIVYVCNIHPLSDLIDEENTVLILFFAFAVGTTFYVFYRYLIGSFLYCFTDMIHIAWSWYDEKPNMRTRPRVSPIHFLMSVIDKDNQLRFTRRYFRARKAYYYIRAHFFPDEVEQKLYFFHTQIYLLYVTSVVGVGYWALLKFYLNGEIVYPNHPEWVVLLLSILLWISAMWVDIHQHERECRIMQFESRRHKLELFLQDYGMI